MGFLSRHIRHHGRFYIALAIGAATFVVARAYAISMPYAAGGDAFFLAYIAASWWQIFRLTHDDMNANAAYEDEGAAVVFIIALASIIFICAGIFLALNRHPELDQWAMVISLAGAPLGWLMLHTLMTFHYGNLFYARARARHPLEFPGTAKPGPWDFLYFSFVIGMTAQTSDVSVKDEDMRRTVTLHGVTSFLFNTVLIALAVNAGVTVTR